MRRGLVLGLLGARSIAAILGAWLCSRRPINTRIRHLQYNLPSARIKEPLYYPVSRHAISICRHALCLKKVPLYLRGYVNRYFHNCWHIQ